MTRGFIRIGVVSDTHLFSRGAKLPELLKQGLQDVDFILHAGDFTEPAVIPLLESIAPLEAVAGNNDGPEIVERFGYGKVLERDGRRIGLTHGHLGPGRSTVWNAFHAFRNDQVDLIVFGHSHVPHNEYIDEVLMFNPGSPTDKRSQPQFSYGIIELGDQISAVHHFYSDKS